VKGGNVKKQQQKQKAHLWTFLAIGAGGLMGLFVLVFFALPAVCPSCAWWSTELPAPSPSESSQTTTIGTKLGEQAPDFALTDIDGQSFELSEFQGKPTIVYFSASWCTPCIPETQELARLKGRYPNLSILWISVDPAGDSAASLREHRRRYARPDFIYALDTTTNEIAKQYQVHALGTVYLLDRNQVIAFRGVRPVGTQAFDQALERVVK
jgi:cytochrome oxidase Cu insertion factor (SCO1/SenC/PrrC family)